MRERRRGGDRDQAQEQLAEMQKTTDQEIMGVLTADQEKMLDEIKGDAFELPEDALPQRGRRGRDRQRSDF